MAPPVERSAHTPAQKLWAGVAIFAAGWVWELIRFWGLQPDYADRFLILLGSGWLTFHAWPDIEARPARPSVLGIPFLLIGSFLFPVGWFIFVQVGPRIVLTWWSYCCLLLMTLGLLAQHRGWFAIRRLAFPLFFLSLALQIPGRLNSPLQEVLQTITTYLASYGIPLFGIDVVREGHVLRLPGGPLGVIEACSGVRSVTALTAIAVFLAHVRGFGLLRGGLVLVLAIPVIILVNVLRVVVSGLLQEWIDPSAIKGWKHEVLGFGAVFVGLGLVAAITSALRPKEAPPTPVAPPSRGSVPVSKGSILAAVGLVVGLVLSVAAMAVPTLIKTAEAGDQSVDRIDLTINSRYPDGGAVQWMAESDIPIEEDIASELTYHKGILRKYRDPLGHEVMVYAFHWTAATTVKGYHHPDVCLPARGFTLKRKVTEPTTTPGGRTVPLTLREFSSPKAALSVAYWTQEGRRFWTEADETDAFRFTYPIHWVMDRLQSDRSRDVDDRIVVLCFAAEWATKTSSKERFVGFVAALADDVYRVCPWADPKGNPER